MHKQPGNGVKRRRQNRSPREKSQGREAAGRARAGRLPWLLVALLGFAGLVRPAAGRQPAPRPAPRQDADTAADALSEAHALHAQLLAKPAGERSAADYERIEDLLTHAAADGDSPDAESARFEAGSLEVNEARDLDLATAWQAAAGQFRTLLEQHPYTAFRRNAEWALAQIEIFYLHAPQAAVSWLRDFLQRYPADPRVPAARKELDGAKIPLPAILPGDTVPSGIEAPPTAPLAALSDNRVTVPAPPAPTPAPAVPAQPPAPAPPAAEGNIQEPAAPPPNLHEFPVQVGAITGIKVWTNPEGSSVVLELRANLRFERGTVPDLHRVYFDLVGGTSSGRRGVALEPAVVNINDGRVNSIRIAENRPGVLRVIIDAVPGTTVDAGHLFPDPWRLIVEVTPTHAGGGGALRPRR